MPMPNRPRPVVRVTRRLPAAVEARLSELFDTTLNGDDVPLDAGGLQAAVAACTVFVPTVTDHIDAAVIAAAGPALRLIANFGAGVDHIDLTAARAKGIVVTNTPGVLTDDTAELVLALILSVPRRLAEGEKLVRAGSWTGWTPTGMLGHRVRGKALGIVGMGRIGQAVATRAAAFGLTIHYHNRRRLPPSVETALGATFHADLHAMLGAVDIVSLNCPHTPATHHLIDAAALATMKPDAYLINVARGEIVDEAALAAALAAGALAGAGLDVFEAEPRITPALFDLPNVVLLPHMGSATFEGRQAMGDKVIANIQSWADGHRPPDQVLDGWV